MTAMNAFHRGNKALFTDAGTNHIVTIVEVIDKSANSEYAIESADGTRWYARENQLTLLAGGAAR
jgi:hypothetical protein